MNLNDFSELLDASHTYTKQDRLARMRFLEVQYVVILTDFLLHTHTDCILSMYKSCIHFYPRQFSILPDNFCKLGFCNITVHIRCLCVVNVSTVPL